MGVLRIASSRGDDEHHWDDADSAKIAQQIFDDMSKNKKYAGFEKQGNDHVLIKQFNPDAEEILMFGPLVGG